MVLAAFNLLPVLIAGVLVAAVRLRFMAYLSVAVALVASLFVFHVFVGTVTTSYHGPLSATGYETWSFPFAATAASLFIGFQQAHRSRTLLFFATAMVSFITMQFGGWLA
jgi:hypothetical protein